MTRADVMYTSAIPANQRNGTQFNPPIITPAGVIYVSFILGDNGLYWIKSTDGGFTWSDPAAISVGESINNVSLWYDKWTPGNTGTVIHFAYIGSSADNAYYRGLDTAADTLGTETVIFDGASTGTVANMCIAIARMRGGNLLCMGDIDGGTEVFFSRSVDQGANWTARTTTGGPEGADYFLVLPGFAADNQDALVMFWDRSASEISRKIYDDSADTFAETSIATSMTALASSTATPHFTAVVDAGQSAILLGAWNARDTANADFRFWNVNETTITEMTRVVADGTDDQTMCSLALATDTFLTYAFYGGKSDGSEVVGTAINIYYKTSTDGAATWGAETKLTLSARNYDMLFACPLFTGNFAVLFETQNSVGQDNMLISVLLPQARARLQIGLG